MNIKVILWSAACLALQAPIFALGVTFQFSAPISLVYGPGADSISNIVAVGSVCTGTVSFTPSAASADLDASPNTGLYRFRPADMQITLQVGTNVFATTPSSTDYIIVNFQLPSPVSDGLTYEGRGIALNQGVLPGATDSQTLDLALSTTNLAALSSDALPTQVPALTNYPFGGGTGFQEVVFYTYKGGSFYYGFSGTLSWLIPVPALSATFPRPGQIALSWPTDANGFVLQSSANPTKPGSWSTVTAAATLLNNTYQSVVPIGPTNQFYRLAISMPGRATP